MQLKHILPTALLGATAAQQTPNLTALLQSTPSLSNLTTFVGQFPDLLNTLGSARNITILAPSNEAFGQLLSSPMGQGLASNPGLIQAILQYHVLNGTFPASAVTNSAAFIPTLLTNNTYANVTGGQRVGAARIGNTVNFYSGLVTTSEVTQADVNFTGGTVHVINRVLQVPQPVSVTALAANLTSLAGALNSTGLIETVDGLRDVTIFAPSNEAFTAIGSALPSLSREALTSILTYHVVNGTVTNGVPGYSSGLANNTSLRTVNGAELRVTIQGGNVFVNAAKVLRTDVLVSGGVVHVIDNVLNPNSTAGPSNPSASNGTPAFSGASSASNVPFTSGISAPTAAIPSTAGPPRVTSAGGAGASASSTAGAAPAVTGAVGAAALFGGAAMLMNY